MIIKAIENAGLTLIIPVLVTFVWLTFVPIKGLYEFWKNKDL